MLDICCAVCVLHWDRPCGEYKAASDLREPHIPSRATRSWKGSWFLVVGVMGALGPGRNVERSEGRSQPRSLHSPWSAFLSVKSHPFISLLSFIFKCCFCKHLIIDLALPWIPSKCTGFIDTSVPCPGVG